MFVPLSFLHPATKTLPLDPVPSPRELQTLPSFEEAASTHARPPKYLVPLSHHVFGQQPRRDILHAAVVYYLDSLRSGTASTKTRGMVAGSRRKLRPQKGSGRARLGRRNNPLLRGGGTIHGPKPRDFATDLPRQMRELALRSALSARWLAGDLHVVSSLHWDAPPTVTGSLRRLLSTRQWDDALVLTAPRDPQLPPPEQQHRRSAQRPSALEPLYTPRQLNEHAQTVRNFVLASSNIPRLELVELHTLTEELHREAANKDHETRKKPGELHAYEVLHRKKLILDLGAVEWLEQKLGGSVFHVEHWENEMAAAQEAAEAEQESLSEEEELVEDEADEIVDQALGQQANTNKA